MRGRTTAIGVFAVGIAFFFDGLTVPAFAAGDGTQIVSLASAPDGVLYAATAEEGGLYRSENGARSWQPIGLQLPPTRISDLKVASDGTVWIATHEGAFRSRDLGEQWTRISEHPLARIWPLDSGPVLVRPWGRGLRNLDDPETDLPSTTDARVFSLAASPDGRLWAGAIGRGVFTSSDAGRTWSAMSSGLANRHVLSLAVLADRSITAGTYGGGVFRLRDGVAWTAESQGLPALSRVQALATMPGGRKVAGTADHGVFISDPGQDAWRTAVSGDSPPWSVSALLPLDENRILAGTWGAGLQLVALDSGTARPAILRASVVALHRDAAGNDYAVLSAGTVFRATSHGSVWTWFADAPTETTAFYVGSNGDLIAGTDTGIRTSADDGRSWVSAPSEQSDARIMGFADDGRSGIFAATFEGGLLRRSPPDNHWRTVPPLADAGFQRFAAVADGGNGKLAVASDDGPLLSGDGGKTWLPFAMAYGAANVAFEKAGAAYIGRWAGPGLFLCPGDKPDDCNLVDAWGSSSYMRRVGPMTVAGDGALVVESPDGIERVVRTGPKSWKSEGVFLANTRVNAMTTRLDGTVLAATAMGLFASSDQGRQWALVELAR